jgi:hypothetical protein
LFADRGMHLSVSGRITPVRHQQREVLFEQLPNTRNGHPGSGKWLLADQSLTCLICGFPLGGTTALPLGLNQYFTRAGSASGWLSARFRLGPRA